MAYIACYVASVPTAKKTSHEAQTAQAAEVFKDHGATRVVECWGAEIPPGKLTSFPMSVQADEDETVVFGWQEWPDKATHDANFQKAMEDPRFGDMSGMAMNMKTMIYGSFDVLIDI